MDVFSRKCIGWELDKYMDTQPTLNALNMALLNRKDMNLSDLIHHSDQGSQYAANEYVEKLNDNAFMESFIKTLKYEEVYLREYESFDGAYENIKKFIEDVYNEKRLHSSIGYKPLNEFERESFIKSA